ISKCFDSLREIYGTISFSEEDIKNINCFKLEREQQQLHNNKTIQERNQNRAKQYELEKKELIGFDFSQVRKKHGRNSKIFEEMKSLITEVQERKIIIYCAHKEECYEISEELQKRLINENLDFFFRKMASEDKDRVLERWNCGITRIMIATIAFGMGINIPNV
ncbi:15965_t:CDS:2, partial [Gigaspora rosea]